MDTRALLASKEDLCFLALACPQVWMTYLFESTSSYGVVASEVSYAVRALFLVALALAVGLCRPPRCAVWSGISVVLLPAMLACSFPGALAAVVPEPYLGWGLVAATACGGMWLYARCVHLYASLDTRRCAAYVLVSFILALGVRAVLSLLPLEATVIVVAPLPAVTIALCYLGECRLAGQPPHEAEEKPVPLRLVPLVIDLVLYGIVAGILRLAVGTAMYADAVVAGRLALQLGFLGFLFWWIVLRKRAADLSFLCQLATMIIITALLASSLLAGMLPDLAAALSSFSRSVVIYVLWLVLAILAHRSQRHAYVVFGVGWSIYMLALCAGMAVGDRIYPVGEPLVLTLILVYVLVIGMVFVVVRFRDADALLFAPIDGEKPSDEVPDEAAYLDYLDRRCNELGAELLTPRELEVMRMICRGRSKGYIAMAMGITEGTVRVHAKHLYAKLNIHSRQELFDLVQPARVLKESL